jgi:hypothetical protein
MKNFRFVSVKKVCAVMIIAVLIAVVVVGGIFILDFLNSNLSDNDVPPVVEEANFPPLTIIQPETEDEPSEEIPDIPPEEPPLPGYEPGLYTPQGALPSIPWEELDFLYIPQVENSPVLPDARSAMEDNQLLAFGGYYWRVLEIQDGRALLLSDILVAHMPFNHERDFLSWATSDVRWYLNNNFINNFSEEEQSLIAVTQVPNLANPWYGASNAAATNDRLFLLCVSEVVRFFGDSGQLSNRPTDESRITDRYNAARVARFADSSAFRWHTRTTGRQGNLNITISYEGEIFMNGNFVNTSGGIRPAMWIYID